MRMVKALLIDPTAQTVTDVEIDADNYKAICEHIDANFFDCARIDPHNAIFVDDEGLVNGTGQHLGGFIYIMPSGYPYTLAGKGLVVASDDEGATVGTELTAAGVFSRVTWLTPEHFGANVVKAAGFEPPYT